MIESAEKAQTQDLPRPQKAAGKSPLASIFIVMTEAFEGQQDEFNDSTGRDRHRYGWPPAGTSSDRARRAHCTTAPQERRQASRVTRTLDRACTTEQPVANDRA